MRALVRDAMREGAVGVSTSLQYPPAPYARDRGARGARDGGGEARRRLRDPSALGGRRDRSPRSTRRSGSAARRGSRSRSGTSRWPASATGAGCPRWWPRSTRPGGPASTSRPTRTPIRPGSTRCRPSCRPGRTTAATRKLIERLRDPATRRRIRREMLEHDELGQRVAGDPGPAAVLIGVVQNPALRQYQGKTLAQVAALRQTDAIDALLDLLVEDQAYTYVAVFGMSGAGRRAGAAAAVGLDQQRLAGHGARRPAGRGASAPAGLRHLSADPPEVRPRGEAAHAGGRDPEVHLASGPADAPRRPRRAQGGACGRTWSCSIRPRCATARPSPRPNQLSEGMQWVLVNGVPVIADGRATGALPGRVLRGAGWSGR